MNRKATTPDQTCEVLFRRRDSLLRNLDGDVSSLHKGGIVIGCDMVDGATANAEDVVNAQLANMESHGLSRIERALEKVRKGEYGICEACGHKIPKARLDALPDATLCIKCQRELERQGAHSVDDADWSHLAGLSDEDRELTLSDVDTGRL